MKRVEDEDCASRDNLRASIMDCDQSEILKNRVNDSVRKALQNYNQYKNEISFTLHSHNSSRCFDQEMCDEVNNLSSIVQRMDDDTESLLKTPIS